jgi:hypothetical protein
MLSLALFVLCVAADPADPVSEAGTAYRQALEALNGKNYEEAVQLLRGALQKLGEESDSLKYRDGIARQRHAYYPYYEWARARLLQAKQETSIFTRRDLLKEALSRLSQTRHPDAAVKVEEAKEQLAVVEKAIELDGSFASAKIRIEVLGTGERFEEALSQLDAMIKQFLTRDKELGDLRSSLKERQTALEKRYEGVLAQRLGDVTLADPVASGDSIAEILKPAKIPVVAVANPGPPFLWLAKFMVLWDKSLETIRRAPDLTADEINALSGSFEAAALDAIDAGVPAGFRAARHVAHAVRMARLSKIATGAEDVIDTTTAATVVKASQGTSARAAESVARLPAAHPDTKSLENDVPTRQKQLDDLSKKIVEFAKERARLTAPILTAETALGNGDTLGDHGALTKLKNDLFELESEANFGTLTPRLRARALMAHALAEATLAFMEGNLPERVYDRCRLPAWRAFGFDPKVDERWKSRLSPKLVKILEQVKQ